MGRRGRRRKQLLDGLKEPRRFWKLEEEAQDPTRLMLPFPVSVFRSHLELEVPSKTRY
jgi:hypothetical protein